MSRIIVVFALVFLSTSSPAQELEHLQYDLDRDGKIDTITLVIPDKWNDPGEFTKVEVSLGKGENISFEESSGWVSYADSADKKLVDWLNTNNLLPSKRVVLLSDNTGNYLFLFGYAYASSPGELEIILFHESGVSSIFKSEFWPVKIENGAPSLRLIGKPCFSQGWGNGCFTYVPFNVLTLGANVTLDVMRTKDFNLNNYYGYVGPECSEAYAVVEQNGRKVVVDEKTANEVCSK